MGWSISAHGADMRFVQSFGRKPCSKETTWKT